MLQFVVILTCCCSRTPRLFIEKTKTSEANPCLRVRFHIICHCKWTRAETHNRRPSLDKQKENGQIRMTTVSPDARWQQQTILMTSGALGRFLGLGRPPPSKILLFTSNTLLVRLGVIRWVSLLQVAQVTEACPTLVLIAPWGVIDNTKGALHVWALIMCTRHTQPEGN